MLTPGLRRIAAIFGLFEVNFTPLLIPMVGILTFWVYPGNYWNSHWWSRWCVMLIMCTVWIGWKFSRIHWTVTPAVTLTLISGLITFAWRDNMYAGQSTDSLVALGKYAAYGTFSFLLLALFALTLKARDLVKLSHGLAFTCMSTSVAVVHWGLFTWLPIETQRALIGNPSMTGGLIAITYPFLALQPRQRLFPWSVVAFIKKFAYVVYPLIAIVELKSSIPLGVLSVVLLTFAALNFNKGILIKGCALAVLPIAIGIYTQGASELFSDSGRFWVWRLGFAHFWNSGVWVKLFGFGLGTTQTLLTQWQLPLQNPLFTRWDWFWWYHNDWLQTFLELGLVGMSAYILLFCGVLYSATKKAPWVMSAILGWASLAFFNYPVRLPLHALIGVLLVAMAHNKEFACGR